MNDSRDVQCVQLFLPLYAPDGHAFPPKQLSAIRTELTERFGGVSCFLASPIQGRWEDSHGDVQRDELVLFEVMTEVLDAEWWRHYRHSLEKRFEQQSVLVRTFASHVI